MAKLTDKQRAEEFSAALTQLSIEHQIGIGGTPVLFVMEPEDNEREYRLNDASELTFG